MSLLDSTQPRKATLPRVLGPIDAFCVVVGCTIGSGIFLVPAKVAQAYRIQAGAFSDQDNARRAAAQLSAAGAATIEPLERGGTTLYRVILPGPADEAEAYANDILPRARGDGEHIRQEAEAYKVQVVNLAQGEANAFLPLLKSYEAAKDVTARRLYLESVDEVLKKASKVIVDTSGKGVSSVMPYMPVTELKAPAASPAPPPASPTGPPAAPAAPAQGASK